MFFTISSVLLTFCFSFARRELIRDGGAGVVVVGAGVVTVFVDGAGCEEGTVGSVVTTEGAEGVGCVCVVVW